MPAPISPIWARTYKPDMTFAKPNGGVYTFANRVPAAIPPEIESFGLNYNTAVDVPMLNEQFYRIAQCIEWIKNNTYKPTISTQPSNFTFQESQYFSHIRFTGATAANMTLNILPDDPNLGVVMEGIYFELYQAVPAAITIVPGANVTLRLKTGHVAKTTGVGTMIRGILVENSGGNQVWDITGETGP